MVAEQGEHAGLMRVRSYTSLDKATIIGLLGGMLALFFAIVLGGSPGSFVDVPSVLLVIVGTMCLTVACYSFAQLRGANRAARGAIRRTSMRPSQVATQLVNFCEVSRQAGMLQLQSKLDVYRDQEFLYQGAEMLVDGTSPEDLERILRLEAENKQDQQKQAIGVLKKAAELAPAMGLIGTLVGLVQMLANLDDPSTIGPSMAVALLTTFYGACLANMVFTPLATKMEGNSEKDRLLYELYIQGLVAVARQESARRLEMLLNTVLPENMKITYFDD
jgi:chemotaxis protein MotA